MTFLQCQWPVLQSTTTSATAAASRAFAARIYTKYTARNLIRVKHRILYVSLTGHIYSSRYHFG